MSPACALTNSASFVPGYRRLMRAVFHLALLAACALAFCRAGYSQSTFGTVLGTVKDPSGSLIPMANVHLMNAGTNAERSAIKGLLASDIPLMFAAAELDLSFFVQQIDLMKQATCKGAKGCARSVMLPQHSHMSEVYAINTADTRLTDQILEFVKNGK